MLHWFRTLQIIAGLCVGFMFPLDARVFSQSPQHIDAKTQSATDNGEVSTETVQKLEPSWQLSIHEGNKAELVVFPGHENMQRVEIIQAETQETWNIQLSQQPLIVEGGEWYDLRFRARADDLRQMGVAVSQAHDPWHDLGLYRTVAVMRQWQDYKWEFRMTADDSHARIHFDLGGWSPSVELASVRLLQLSHGNPRWELNLREGNEAGLVPDPEGANGLRVAIASAQIQYPHHIQLVQKGIHIQAKKRYHLEFFARADAHRSMQVGISQVEYPWEGLGLDQEVPLTPEWQPFELEFEASRTYDNARLYFNLGGANIPVSIKAVMLQDHS